MHFCTPLLRPCSALACFSISLALLCSAPRYRDLLCICSAPFRSALWFSARSALRFLSTDVLCYARLCSALPGPALLHSARLCIALSCAKHSAQKRFAPCAALCLLLSRARFCSAQLCFAPCSGELAPQLFVCAVPRCATQPVPCTR
jgi:hypothetical protein